MHSGLSDRTLFWVPTLIWATTWHAILYQLGETSALHSVAFRFGLASVMLFAIAHWRGEAVRLPKSVHAWLLLTGAVQYGLNYLCTYESERHLASGLVAVLFSLMIFTNAIGGSLFFGQHMTRRFWLSGAVGVVGIALIFWPDIVAARGDASVLFGVALALTAVTLASTGNMLTLRLTRQGTPLVPLLAWSMGYGAVTLMAIAMALQVEFHLDVRPGYWVSLFYLSGLGSVAAFLLYFKLAQRQGPGRAALTGLVIPVIALLVSAALEGWRPTPLSTAGIALCLVGLWGATRPAAAAPTAAPKASA
jgi:drug/metabolite transporter (DMT)-like permease